MGGLLPSGPPNLLPRLMVPRSAGSWAWATMLPGCHTTALIHATKVYDFPVPAPPVKAVMHGSSSTWHTTKACEGFRQWRCTMW